MHQSSHLKKLYIEATNQCNLNCRTCIRNIWDEPQGKMSRQVFSRLVDGLKRFTPVPNVVFGGMGEPLFHPDIVEMVRKVKSLGGKVDLITNGTLLSKELSLALIRAGLDRLWVSLDGATPENFADVRLGAVFQNLLGNLHSFSDARKEASVISDCGSLPRAELGISFVAMKRNISELPAVVDIGRSFGAKHFLVTNVLPYTKEMIDEILYERVINMYSSNYLSLPRMDVDETTYLPLFHALQNSSGNYSGIGFESGANHCPFIESGAGAINWEGNLSPCIPLMYNYVSYLSSLEDIGEHTSHHWSIGNIQNSGLLKLWNKPEHLAFRERVSTFDFPPCYSCGGCDLLSENEEDCLGNKFPVCGGCLWAQGVIQCP